MGERTPEERHRAMVQENAKELARPLAAAVEPHIPHREFEEAICALRAAGFYEDDKDMSASEIVTIVLQAAAKVRK